ncbi:MAG: dihydrodipicolinate synthase family protein [Phycisphaerae bacterium]|jgi:4-hydroxy-tetrahydrodipicolinate synthase
MPRTKGLNRRELLKLSAAGAAALLAPRRGSALASAPSPAAREPVSPADFRQRLRGPILSIPTPFTADFKVDYDGVRRMIERAAKAGVSVFALTMGNGQYAALLYEEIKELTRVVVEAAAGRGLTISAAGNWWTGQVVDYARFAESVGADSVQIMVPEGCGEDGCVEHFKAVAAATRLPLVLHGDYSVALLEKLVRIDSVAALKEDVTLDYYIDRQRRFGDRLAIFGGGTEYRFLVAWPYGSRAYYSAYAAFAPEVSMKLWRAVQNGDSAAAYRMVNTYDHPFLARWSHGFWRASLEHFGVAGRFLRPPQPFFTDAQMKDVAAFYDGLDLRPR